jgi:hypothetical protein
LLSSEISACRPVTHNSRLDTMACELGDNSISIANLESPDDDIEVAKLHGHEGAVRALLWLHEKG